MHASITILETLEALGLTEYQARAYTALLSPGSATAEEVSRLSGVPRSKVYSVLDELKRKKWVDVERGRPLRFSPRDPRTVIEEKFGILRSAADDVKDEMGREFEAAAASRPEPDVEFLMDGGSIIEKELDLIDSAEHIIVITGALYYPEELEAIIPHLFRAADRGVTLVVLTSARTTVGGLSLDIKDALSDIPGKMRFEETSAGIKKMLVDGKHGMVLYAEQGADGIEPSTIQAVATRNRAFLESFNPQ